MADPPSCSACGRIPSQGAEFCGGCGSPLPRRCTSCAPPQPGGQPLLRVVRAAARRAAVSRPAGASERAGERRYVTVMFCDLVGSTALSAELDPEDMRRVIQGYQARCLEVITAFDGSVAQYPRGRHPGLLRLSGGPRGRRGRRRARRPRNQPSDGAAGRGARRGTPRGPGRAAHRARRRRRDGRSDRRAVRRRRARDRGDAQHRRAAAVAGPAGGGGDRREHRRAGPRATSCSSRSGTPS